MQWLTLALGAVLVLSIYGDVPLEQHVRIAIRSAKELNALKRAVNMLSTRELGPGADIQRCPLANFHGRQSGTHAERDNNVHDMLTAVRSLLEQGFKMDDIKHKRVIEEFKRNFADVCKSPDTGTCDDTAEYRTANGSCNNLNNKAWGMAGSTQRRELQNAYSDTLSEPRVNGVNGAPLPNARNISNIVHSSTGRPIRSSELTLHAFQFGQFLDHDMIRTDTSSVVSDCCNSNDVDNCFAIKTENVDDRPFRNISCMNFQRSSSQLCSSEDTNGDIKIVREQINSITSYIDASNVYGSSLDEQRALRDLNETPGQRGLMKMSGNRLPPDEDGACHKTDGFTTDGYTCSKAGDVRVDVQPALSAEHTMFVREHNRIAIELNDVNDDDEVTFQKTRQIIGAIMQKIVYDEFLASFLSTEAMDTYGLRFTSSYEYDDTIDATIQNAFGIGFRFGHTWIPFNMTISDVNFRTTNTLPTEDTYENVDMTYYDTSEGLNGLIRWLTAELSPETDGIVEDSARNKLFQNITANISFDIVALNIQRGRDHGLPSYNEFRKWCGLSELHSTWTVSTLRGGLVDHTPSDSLRLLDAYPESLYSPRDIDLFTGLTTEKHVDGSAVGPTLECLLGRQFQRLKYGDRYWYQGDAANFNTEQQQAIEGYSLAKILCNNMKFERVNYPNAFLRNRDNRLTDCDDIPDLNIDIFKQVQQGGGAGGTGGGGGAGGTGGGAGGIGGGAGPNGSGGAGVTGGGAGGTGGGAGGTGGGGAGGTGGAGPNNGGGAGGTVGGGAGPNGAGGAGPNGAGGAGGGGAGPLRRKVDELLEKLLEELEENP